MLTQHNTSHVTPHQIKDGILVVMRGAVVPDGTVV
jgi:hypothetical protein